MKTIFADDVADLQMNSTSVRFTLVQRDTKGGFSEVARVILPAVSAPEVFKAMADGLTNAEQEFLARRREREAGQG